MTKRSTPQRPASRPGRPSPESVNRCPTWCDSTPGHERADGSHFSDAMCVPVVRQLNPDIDPPTVAVYIAQREDGPRVANAPLLHVDGGDSDLTPEQGERLLVAIADQLALLEPRPATGADAEEWGCPLWCTLTVDEHVEEGPALDGGKGGAIHKSSLWEAAGSPYTDVRAYVETDLHRGTRPLIFLGDRDIDAATARQVALNLLRAAALVEES